MMLAAIVPTKSPNGTEMPHANLKDARLHHSGYLLSVVLLLRFAQLVEEGGRRKLLGIANNDNLFAASYRAERFLTSRPA